jgi:hypothetical protein
VTDAGVLMDVASLSPAVVWLAALWLVALSLQLADIGTARFDARLLARGARTIVRLHAVAWVVPLAAIAVVAAWLGLDHVSRLIIENEPTAALLLAGVVVVGLAAAWVIITVAVTRPADDSYRAIRDELIDLAGTRARQERLDELRARLTTIDDDRRSAPPSADSRRSAMGWVLRRPQRAVPTAIALAMFIVSLASRAPGWELLASVVAVGLSTVLAVSGARASLTLVAAVRDAQVEYRGEVVHLLAEAEKSSKKPVAGLGERVTRALQILREQQD